MATSKPKPKRPEPDGPVHDPCIEDKPAPPPPPIPRWFIHTEEGVGHVVLDLEDVRAVLFDHVVLTGLAEPIRFQEFEHVAAAIAQAFALYRKAVKPAPPD